MTDGNVVGIVNGGAAPPSPWPIPGIGKLVGNPGGMPGKPGVVVGAAASVPGTATVDVGAAVVVGLVVGVVGEAGFAGG